MFCLSKLCCFCLRSNIQLKALNKLTQFSTSLMDMIKILFVEPLFSELGQVLSICKDCTQQVKEMHSFWQTSINSNEILMKYLRQLRLLGNDYGHIQVQINDFMYSADPDIIMYKNKICANKNNYTDENKATDGDLIIKQEDDQECSQELSGIEGDTTMYKTPVDENCQYKNQTNTEENEFKIKIYDNFEAMQGPTTIKKELKPEILEVHTSETREVEEREYKIEMHDDFEEILGHLKPEYNDTTENEESTPIHQEQMSEFLDAHICKTRAENEIEEFLKETEEPIPKNSKPHICESCGKIFTQNIHLAKHLLTHTGEKPHNRKSCGKSFTRKNHLTNHMLTHAGEKPHECEICGKSYLRKKSLTDHMFLHTGANPYNCKSCGKSFFQRSNLTSHMLTHTGEKPHDCKFCGKSYSTKCNLTRHMLIHTGEKPHECKPCGKSFTQKSDLTRHMLTHSDEKPHECETCGKFFADMRNLTRHLSKHTSKQSKPVVNNLMRNI